MADKNSAFRGHGYAVRFFLAVLALLSGFALSVSGKTTIDFDPKIDFSKFKTFAYVGGVENLAAIERRKAIAESHRRCQIQGRTRGHRNAVTERRMISPSPKFQHSSRKPGGD